MKNISTPLKVLAVTAFCCAPFSPSVAQVKTWEGDDPVNPNWFGDANNWVGDDAAGFQNYQYYASTALTKTIEMVDGGGSSLFRTGVDGINLEGAGWVIQDTIGGGAGGLRYDFDGTAAKIGAQPYGINSTGAGVNEIKSRFQIASGNTPDTGQPDRPFTVGTGNTLLFSGTWEDGQGITIQGDGRLVVNNTDAGSNKNNAFNASYVMNGTVTLLNRGSMQFSGTASSELDSGTIGGDGIFYLRSGTTMSFEGTTLSPGGDDTAIGGGVVGDLTFESGLTTNRAEVALTSGTSLIIDLGSGGVGDNDEILLDLYSTNGSNGKFDIGSGVTLDLRGTTIQNGTYTFITDVGSSGDFTGTFDTVNFNGSAASASNFTVNYGVDAISVTVVGIPEPGSMVLLLLGGLTVMLFRKRRK